MPRLEERRFFWALWRTPGRRAYARDADSIFDPVAATTGSRVLIDSSKNISRAAALAGDSRHDIRVLHLIRDGRGVLRSRRKRAEVDGRPYREKAALAEWLGKNLMISWLLARRLPADRFLLARYEDLLTDPAAELKRSVRSVGPRCQVVEAAMTTGVERLHLFEPIRRTTTGWSPSTPPARRTATELHARTAAIGEGAASYRLVGATTGTRATLRPAADRRVDNERPGPGGPCASPSSTTFTRGASRAVRTSRPGRGGSIATRRRRRSDRRDQ